VIAWWILAARARAADVGEEADLQFQLGIRDYEAGNPQDALGHLLMSHRLVPNRNVEYNLARVYEELGQLDAAWTHYHAYVEATPDATARADGEAALARLDKDVARVKITSTPPGATVYVGRVDLGPRGTTPLTIALPAGKRAIVLDLDGYVRAETTAELTPGKEARTAVELLPVPPVARPTGAEPFQAVVRAGAEVVVSVEPDSCALLPSRVTGAGAPRPHASAPAAAPGSVLGALGPLPPLVLDVTAQGVTARTVLGRAERSGALVDSVALRAWVFERCTPTDGKGGLAAGLAALPPAVRAEAVAVFAEWAAVRNAADVSRVASTCLAGDCAGLVGALVGR
jgi:hypothetical protein